MRTDRQTVQVESTERPAGRSDASAAPSVNGNGAHVANGAAPNGVVANGVHTNGARSANGVVNGVGHALVNGAHPETRVVHVEPDWDNLLPARAETVGWKVGQKVKRGLDVVLASAGLLALSPLFAVVAALVKLTSRGPVFYVSDYVGHRGRRFPGYKFRTMVADAESKKSELDHLNHMKGPAFKIRNDPRVTRVGRFLRKYSIDELPQLWNVVRGDMSLVGPRPPLPEEWVEYKEWQRAKLAVIPGITCYWQINGRSEITDFDEWARLDLKYIERWSLWTDAKILVRTIPAVIKGHGAY